VVVVVVVIISVAIIIAIAIAIAITTIAITITQQRNSIPSSNTVFSEISQLNAMPVLQEKPLRLLVTRVG
jgi:hypothetical protein